MTDHTPPTPELLARARRHLSRRYPVLRKLLRQIGPCTLHWNGVDHFTILARSIISQQISTHAARAIAGRVVTTLGKRGLTPLGIRKATDEALRAAGLSANKVLALRDLADKCHAGDVPLDRL